MQYQCLFPVFVTAFFAKALIKVDFPTFGIPTTIARIGRFLIPRRLSRSVFIRVCSKQSMGWKSAMMEMRCFLGLRGRAPA